WLDAQAEWLEVRAELSALRERVSSRLSIDTADSGSADPTASDGYAGLDDGGDPREAAGMHQTGPGSGDPVGLSDPGACRDRLVLSPPFGAEGHGQIGELMPPHAQAAHRDVARLPQVWGDVPPRNPNFVGRESLLHDLRERLASEREAAVLPHARHGMGGVGKSQVAIEYVHRYRGDYDLIWWIAAEHPGQVLSALTALAHRLDVDLSREPITAVPAVREA